MATPGVFKELGLMTTSEAAALVGVHRATIWNAIQQGHIPTKLIGNSNALRLEDVATFRDNYLRFKVTSTSATPAKKGRPLGSKNLHRVVVEPAPPPVEELPRLITKNKDFVEEAPAEPVAVELVDPLTSCYLSAFRMRTYSLAPTEAASVTNCSACSGEILDTEVQMCEHCGEDGLGNCCIGIGDHDCVRPSDCG